MKKLMTFCRSLIPSARHKDTPMAFKKIEIDGVTFSVSKGSGQAEKLRQLVEARDELANARKEIERMRKVVDRAFEGLAGAP